MHGTRGSRRMAVCVSRFHMGVSCPDYDWEDTLKCLKAARAPLLATVAISDEVEVDGVAMSWNGLQLVRVKRNRVAPLQYVAGAIWCD